MDAQATRKHNQERAVGADINSAKITGAES